MCPGEWRRVHLPHTVSCVCVSAQVSGGLKYVSSGDGVVMGVSWKEEIFRREGITATNPVGTKWTLLNGRLELIDCYLDYYWGVNHLAQIYHN